MTPIDSPLSLRLNIWKTSGRRQRKFRVRRIQELCLGRNRPTIYTTYVYHNLVQWQLVQLKPQVIPIHEPCDSCHQALMQFSDKTLEPPSEGSLQCLCFRYAYNY